MEVLKMNPNKIAEVRKLVEQSQQSGKRPHYSEAIKTLAKSLLRDGVTRSELMSATGISRATLANWSGPAKQNFRKLKAVPTPASQVAPIRLSLSNGVSIELSDVALLKSILEQLVP